MYPTLTEIIDAQVTYIHQHCGPETLTNLGWGVSYDETTGKGWVSSKAYGHGILDSCIDEQGHIIHKFIVRPL